MTTTPDIPKNYPEEISKSGLTIYSPIEVGDPTLWIPAPQLEVLLDTRLRGISLSSLALRTRSKAVKEKICTALGYPVPRSFKKTKPRFPGQCFDVYGQKANNLQIWNEEISSTRRYVLVRISNTDIVQRVKVITGDDVTRLDTTGKLTKKYQASLTLGNAPTELIVNQDTEFLRPIVLTSTVPANFAISPVSYPTSEALLPISDVYQLLSVLIGKRFSAMGFDQERNRGGELHRLVCHALGYTNYQDDGRFPDVRHQLLEVKLQTSATIDLGLVRPDSIELLDIPQISGHQVRHCDVRYAIYYASNDGATITLTHLFLTTGQAFFGRFRQFQGNVLNEKLQIHLPRTFFD